jgi:putative ABC transport system permease protein
MLSDLRYGLRQLIKNPAFTIVAVITLALGIGANTAIFSVVNAVLLKPLPFPQPNELVAFGAIDARESGKVDPSNVSYPDFFDLREQNRTFASMAVHRPKGYALISDGGAQTVQGRKVSAEFFDVLGVKPVRGRGFERGDEQADGGAGGFKVVLSHQLWQRMFSGNPNVLGQTLQLDGRPYSIIGVMPEGFQYPFSSLPVEVWTSIAEDATAVDGGQPYTTQRGSHSLDALGRLKGGVSIEQANADLKNVAALLAKQYPDTNTNKGAAAVPLRDELVGDVKTALYVLFGAVACVLLIANANVANLLLARASVRGKEIALRAALGASRARVIRQLLTETLLLAALGGFFGLLLALWGTEALIAVVPQSIPRIGEIQLDGTVLGFTILMSLGTGLLFGLVPAWQASHVDLNSALKTGSRSGGGGEHKHRMRSALVVAEVALALVLLVCAGLLIQSFNRLGQVQPGVRTENLFTARVWLPDAAYPQPANVNAFFDQLITRVRTLPGVNSASFIFPLPLSGSNNTTSFDIEERPAPQGEQPDAPTRIAGTDYFKTMAIPVLQGRAFDETDRLDSRPVVIVNERFAEKYFPNANPIGKRITPGWSVDEGPAKAREIIGVVGNVRHASLSKDFTPEVYLPAAQIPFNIHWLVVRTNVSDPATLTSAIRGELAAVDRNLPLTHVKIFDEYMSQSLARPRFNALLLSIFAGIALLLTAIGIYGVMAYSVSQRTNEIGIRIALGAAQSSIFKLIVGQAMMLVGISLVIGLAGAFAATRLLSTLLYGIGAWDPLTFGSIVVLIAVVAFLAAWLPARRASRVNPIIALRAE